MKKSQRMNSVVQLADKAERQQAERFSKSQQYCDNQRRKLEELQQYYQEYNASAAAPGSGMDLQRLQETRHFMSKLAHAISLQKDQLRQAESNMSKERGQWLSSRQRSMSMEKLKERYQDDECREENRREQFVADDMSAQRFFWAARTAESMA